MADQFQQGLRDSQGVLSSFNTLIKDWRTQVTVTGTVLFAIAKRTANFGEVVLKGAQKTGQTVQTFRKSALMNLLDSWARYRSD